MYQGRRAGLTEWFASLGYVYDPSLHGVSSDWCAAWARAPDFDSLLGFLSSGARLCFQAPEQRRRASLLYDLHGIQDIRGGTLNPIGSIRGTSRAP
jgi:hypothetical protein